MIKKLSSFWDTLVSIIISSLKNASVKAALIKFLGSPYASGFRAWLIKVAVTELFDYIAKPIILQVIRDGKRWYDSEKGKYLYAKLLEYEADNNQPGYDDTIDDIVGFMPRTTTNRTGFKL